MNLLAGTSPEGYIYIFDRGNGSLGQKKWPFTGLVFQFGSYSSFPAYFVPLRRVENVVGTVVPNNLLFGGTCPAE